MCVEMNVVNRLSILEDITSFKKEETDVVLLVLRAS